ncbi:MAG: dihydroxy-acid dehydratase [Candidatus Lokiarchaeota archaeon]|nr:dihydroxy-acid dehydratase [Candidatus Lokiarchaeota archaeon]MBD3341081.1 dihydroxy-acid dehydratase [Candidatus Lokiarchaeota archaeon]
MSNEKPNLKKRSDQIFEVIKNTAFYYAPLGIISGTGLEEKEIHKKPFIGVVNTWNELNPGHMHLRHLAEGVKFGIAEAGGTSFEFNTVAPCDGWANANIGMRFILPQRDIIADSIEAMVEAHRLDAIVTLSSCDKINPGVLMAVTRLDIPTICVPGGPNLFEIAFMPGYEGVDVKIYDDFKRKTSCISCATAGACEFMGTANTTQCLMEAFGMTLPNAATIPAFTRMKYVIAKNSGRKILDLLKKNITPSQIMTEKSLENVMTIDAAIGGSTNAALHIPAIAHEMGIDFDIESFNEYSKKVPMIVNTSPSGDYGVSDLYGAGGIPAVMSRIKDFLNLDCMTVSEKNIGRLIRRVKVLDDNIIRPLENPVFQEGGTVILKGNLAPKCAVVKQSAVGKKELLKFEGPAKVFDSEMDALKALSAHKINNGDIVVVRYEGPKGGPGMPELVALTSNLMIRQDMSDYALITDGRFSGASQGPCIGHVSPEAYVGGPIAIIKTGDIVKIDIPNRKLDFDISKEEIEKRFENWRPHERDIKSKTLLKYRALVDSAAKGAILRF